MTVTGTGKWVKSEVTQSVQDRDFHSGPLAVANTTYDGTNVLEFGFSAPEVHIVNTSGQALVFQWLSRSIGGGDSGVVQGNSSMVFRSANKQGIRLRTDSTTINCYVIALG